MVSEAPGRYRKPRGACRNNHNIYLGIICAFLSSSVAVVLFGSSCLFGRFVGGGGSASRGAGGGPRSEALNLRPGEGVAVPWDDPYTTHLRRRGSTCPTSRQWLATGGPSHVKTTLEKVALVAD